MLSISAVAFLCNGTQNIFVLSGYSLLHTNHPFPISLFPLPSPVSSTPPLATFLGVVYQGWHSRGPVLHLSLGNHFYVSYFPGRVGLPMYILWTSRFLQCCEQRLRGSTHELPKKCPSSPFTSSHTTSPHSIPLRLLWSALSTPAQTAQVPRSHCT